MKSRRIVIPLVVSLALTLILTWALTDRLGPAEAAPSAELHVCPTCTYTSVQEAVDAANGGDTIKVAAGTYTDLHRRAGITQVVYVSKTVTIRGGYTSADWTTSDPQANPTILDAQGGGRVLVIESPASPFQPVQAPGASATAQSIAPLIEGLQITGGDAAAAEEYGGYAGGGVYVLEAEADLNGNWIYDNHAGDYGYGGGVYVGRIFFSQEVPISTLRANRVYSNSAGEGSGIALEFSEATLINNAVIDNRAYMGADVAVLGSTCRMWHTTVARNTAEEGGLGISIQSGQLAASAEMTNTIVTNHGFAGIHVDQLSAASLNGVLWYGNGSNTSGGGTLTVNDELTATPAFASDGYHLTSGSAAIDRGLGTPVLEDIDGQMRPQGDGPDLGADEYSVGNIIIAKETDPPGGVDFSFTGDLGSFALDHGDEQVFSELGAGAYTVTESLEASFDLTGLTCVEDIADNSDTDLEAREATIHLDPGEAVTCTFSNTVSAPASGGATDSDGLARETYAPEETVYATGSGFVANTVVDIHVVPDLTWSDGLLIPPDVSRDGVDALPTDGSGNLGPAAVWSPQLVPGEYDLVFDANRNGRYDAATDAVDDPNHPGFVVEPIEVLVDPGVGATLVYTDPQGLPTIIQIPPAAVAKPVRICFSPLLSPTHSLPPGVTFGEHAFQLGVCGEPPTPIPVGGVTFPPLVSLEREVRDITPLLPYLPIIMRDNEGGSRTIGSIRVGRGGGAKVLTAPSLRALGLADQVEALDSIMFEEPVTITIHYSDDDVEGIDENDLRLLYWTGSEWADASSTCSPPSNYVRDPVNNVLQVEICHLSEFAFGG